MLCKSKFIGACVIAVFLCLISSEQANAQRINRIWLNRNARITSPFTDLRASRPGDILVVMINENSDVQNTDNRILKQEGAADSSISANLAASGFVGSATGGLTADEQTSGTRDFKGNAGFGSSRTYQDRFTVKIVDILPNGNMLLSGTRNVNVGGDTKTLVVSGVVRRFDVTANNTVNSQDIADLNIRYVATGNGAEQSFINQGWLGRKANTWWKR